MIDSGVVDQGKGRFPACKKGSKVPQLLSAVTSAGGNVRRWDAADKEWLRRQQDEKLSALFSSSFAQLFEPFGESVPPFVTFMRQVRCHLIFFSIAFFIQQQA